MKPKYIAVVAALAAFTMQLASAASLPEFMTPTQLQAMRAGQIARAAASQAEAAKSETATMYTGKISDTDSGGYLFKYRNYNPELARWTTVDPSGFPDGANNAAYMPVPNSEFDRQGLLVNAQYSIRQMILTIDGTEYSDCNSGNNNYEERNAEPGPIPTGKYRIFSRDGTNPSYNGHQAFILDPVDGLFGNARNDIWDSGEANGRWGFRIHTNVSTTGCIATASIDAIAAQLWSTDYHLQQDIVQDPNRIPGARTFTNQWFLGTLTVTE
jgi:RHS repeat-associated protein